MKNKILFFLFICISLFVVPASAKTYEVDVGTTSSPQTFLYNNDFDESYKYLYFSRGLLGGAWGYGIICSKVPASSDMTFSEPVYLYAKTATNSLSDVTLGEQSSYPVYDSLDCITSDTVYGNQNLSSNLQRNCTYFELISDVSSLSSVVDTVIPDSSSSIIPTIIDNLGILVPVGVGILGALILVIILRRWIII